MEARLEQHALERRANGLASDPECPWRQRYRACRSHAAELDGANDLRTPRGGGAGTSRASHDGDVDAVTSRNKEFVSNLQKVVEQAFLVRAREPPVSEVGGSTATSM